jgi:hypothetical protein
VSRVTDDKLQEYLDGRLTAEQRAEFERLLESDEELAGRIEAYREQGRALREDGPELSPGFYTRVRARFEEARPVKKRGIYRLVSWEVAGLAAAAALAGILFVPGLVQWGGKGEPFIEPKPAVEEKVQAGKQHVAEPPPAPADDLAPIEQHEEEWEAAADEEPRQEGFARQASPKKEAPRAQPTYADAPAEAAPPPAAAREKKGSRAVRRQESEKRLEAMGVADTYAPAPPDRIQLPRGAVGPGELIVIECEEQWLGIRELSALPYDPAFRWALIGARTEGLDCAGIAVETTSGSHRIRLQPGAAWGCAIPFPYDGRTIEVIPAI